MKTRRSQSPTPFDSEETVFLDESTQKEVREPDSKKIMGAMLPAAALTTGGIFIAMEAVPQTSAPSEETETREVPSGPLPVATSVNNSLGFVEAFNAAREEVGAGGLFSWHGNIYSTYSKEEWEAMSSLQHSQYDSAIAQTSIEVEPWEEGPSAASATRGKGAAEGAQMMEVSEVREEEKGESEPSITQVRTASAEESMFDKEYHIHSVNTVSSNEGSATIINASIEGHSAQFIDGNGDGTVDELLVDRNDDGVISQDEIFTPEGTLTVENVQALATGVDESQGIDEGIFLSDDDGLL